MELETIIDERIKVLCKEGDAFVEESDFKSGLVKYWESYDLLPEPKIQWEAATWILTSIGDANYLSGDYQAGRDNFAAAMHCPDAIGNPFIHMRLGQCCFELGELEKAADELTRAYMGAGETIFEEDDPKYLEYLWTKIKKPVSNPWWKFWGNK